MNTQRVEGHTPTLKPCPFCGSEPEVQPWHGGKKSRRMIGCPAEYDEQCSAAPHVIGETLEEASERWNRRASIERLEKVNEALVRYAEQVRDCKYVPDYVHEWSEAVLRLAKEPA